jgi:hypothetical protein
VVRVASRACSLIRDGSHAKSYVAKAAGPEFGGQRVQGVAQDGSDLVISHDYISRGLRSRVEDPTSAERGAKPEHETVPCGRRSPTPCARATNS